MMKGDSEAEDKKSKLAKAQEDAIQAMLLDEGVPRNRDELKNLHGLELWHAKWQEQRGNFDSARVSYQRALKNRPQSVEAQVGLAHLLQLEKEPGKAETAYKAVLKKQPNSAFAYHAIGSFYASQKRWNEAIPMLKAASGREPKNSQFHYDLGIALTKNGQVKEAVSEMAQSVGEAEAYYNVGYLLQQDGHVDLGRQQMSIAIAKKQNLNVRDNFNPQQSPTSRPNSPGKMYGSERLFVVDSQVTRQSPDSSGFVNNNPQSRPQNNTQIVQTSANRAIYNTQGQQRQQFVQSASGWQYSQPQHSQPQHSQPRRLPSQQLPMISPAGSAHNAVQNAVQNSARRSNAVPARDAYSQQQEQMRNQSPY